jgi:transposase
LATEKVLTAILFVLSEGCTWRAIDAPGVRWNSVYQYYRRWCRDGLWEQVWQSVAPATAVSAVYLDSSHIKVHRSGLNPAGGRETQALGLTKGGWNTKVHAAVDRRGVPRALFLSGGNVADIYHAKDVLEEVAAWPVKLVVADKGYDSDDLRIWLYEQGVTPCIPPKSNRTERLPYRRSSYRKRHLVENFFAHLKTFRRVATRYDKLADTFFGWVLLAVILKFGL